MNNFEHLKSMSKNKMADFLSSILRESCCHPKEYNCRKCVAKSLCDVVCESKSKYSIVKWLESEVEDEQNNK